MERRSFLLLGAAAVGLSGCTLGDPDRADPTAPGPTTPPADEDAGVRASVAASELALIASYRAAIEVATEELAGRLEPLLAHHVAHLARIAPEAATPTATASPGTDRPDRSPTGPTDAPAVPSALATVEALAEAESKAQANRTRACDSALDAGLARDLCLIAASEAQHVEVLARLARTLAS